MKSLALIILLFTGVSGINAQTVQVSQGFVDDATKAFIELRAERAVNRAQEAEISAKNEQIRLQSLLIESLKQSIESRDAQIKALSALRCDTTSFLWGIVKKKSCK